jgi:hypothetical protein
MPDLSEKDVLQQELTESVRYGVAKGQQTRPYGHGRKARRHTSVTRATLSASSPYAGYALSPPQQPLCRCNLQTMEYKAERNRNKSK